MRGVDIWFSSRKWETAGEYKTLVIPTTEGYLNGMGCQMKV